MKKSWITSLVLSLSVLLFGPAWADDEDRHPSDRHAPNPWVVQLDPWNPALWVEGYVRVRMIMNAYPIVDGDETPFVKNIQEMGQERYEAHCVLCRTVQSQFVLELNEIWLMPDATAEDLIRAQIWALQVKFFEMAPEDIHKGFLVGEQNFVIQEFMRRWERENTYGEFG